ncbi:MAG: NADH-quinone oxidoreductase subunit L [Thermodesulfovibrionales bacterium]|nr:NADH-quinone oxidoreductase subunit L [Thermodesulfovibrionales bacterium]
MKLYLLIPFLPLAAFVINILFGRTLIRDKAHWVSCPTIIGSLVVSVITLIDVINGKIINEDLYTWVVSEKFIVSIGFLIDQLTAVMLIVVTGVGSLIFIYSIGYMHGDKGYYRYFAYLSLFVFFMLMLVMGNNFLVLYLGWEGVGLCSYFLIGFWFEKKSASDAGKKAFITCRFGDFGFALGVILIFLTFGTLHYVPVFDEVKGVAGQTINILGWEVDLITLIALLLFAGAVGKSAQIPLHVWLPDAMEGPTPVSALIHAATMVTAGVFMVARCNPIFNLSEVAMLTVAVIGAVTSLFAATIAIFQNDIKRIIAYSTISHLGMMFAACGVGAYAAGIFHLYTHGFFKALLFLAAGSVIHAAHHNDIQRMGGLKKYQPITYITMLIAALSAGGIPGLAGFFSKDEIIWSTFASGSPVGTLVWILMIAIAFFTPFYSFRMIFLTFHGKFRGTHEEEHHLHESPPVMTIPLMLLAAGALGAGWVGIPTILGGGAHIAHFLEPVLGHPELHGTHAQEFGVMGLSTTIALSGIVIAAILYLIKTYLPLRLAQGFSGIYRVVFNKYYVDELYNLTIVKPGLWIADSFIERFTDAKIIEGIVNGVPRSIGRFAGILRKVQTGITQHYAIIMAAGVFILIVLILW